MTVGPNRTPVRTESLDAFLFGIRREAASAIPRSITPGELTRRSSSSITTWMGPEKKWPVRTAPKSPVLRGDRIKKGWLVRRQGFKGKGSGAKEDPSPASMFIIDKGFLESQ